VFKTTINVFLTLTLEPITLNTEHLIGSSPDIWVRYCSRL